MPNAHFKTEGCSKADTCSPEPLKFVALNILGPLPQIENRNKTFDEFLDRSLKTTGAVLESMTTATNITTLSLDHSIVPYGISDFL